MSTKPISGYRLDKSGKLTKRPPRMAPVLARAQKAKADRQEKQWRRESKPAPTIAWKEDVSPEEMIDFLSGKNGQKQGNDDPAKSREKK